MLINILLITVGVFVLFQVTIRILKKLFRLPAPAFLGRLLDSSFRRKFQSPAEVIRRSGIKEGMRVLDLGSGSGAYTTFIARAVGEKGWVYAVDIQPAMLKQLEKKLSRPENKNIKNV
jgi:SAM-dependent methyltransferase